MSLSYDPAKNLRLYPMSLRRFGLNPYQDALYRIVFAPSRRNLAGNETGFHWGETYYGRSEQWIMEKWVSAWDFAKCTRETWDERLLIPGPYPSRGEYVECWAFRGPVADANLDGIIGQLEASSKVRYSENRRALKDDYERDTRERSAKVVDIIHNALPAFGSAAFSGGSVMRGSKTAPILRSANELRLPVGNNKFVSGRKRHARG